MTTIQGACNCGAVKISFPKSSFPESCTLCHCLGCRSSSGGLFSTNLVIPTKDIKIEGTPKVYKDKETDSGHTTGRNFCGDCGSPIMSVVEEAPDTAYVKGGLFAKHGTELPPVGYEVYFKRSEPWETAAKGAHVVEG